MTQTILDETNTGRTYTWDVKSSIMGFQRETVAEKIVKIYDIPLTVDEYLDRAQELIELYMSNCKTCPGNYQVQPLLISPVFFVFDSVFPATEKIYQTVFTDICKRYDKPFPMETRFKVLGTTERRSCEITVEDCKLPITVDEFVKQYKELSLSRLGNAPLLIGIYGDLMSLASNFFIFCYFHLLLLAFHF